MSTNRTAPRRKPRFVLGTFWLLLGLLSLFGGFSGPHAGLLIGPLLVAYTVSLYQGGRFGVPIW